ncbi:hypothetical protein EG327_006811 [Venturia inaequalis]|uniref:HTH myb-type domain-containing protein n=1 Tax=Venturia inaequalis TaxID=5025 RepID=A0A8H3VPK7_VENIN|nr:hypothetical protein EG327_006811 [Venturia inaequalis]
MSQPTDQTIPYAAAPPPQSSSSNPRKRRASGQPNPQMTPSPIAPAPMPTSSTFAESSSGHPAPTQDSGQQPPAKKGRTNTPWTPAEELRLKHMRDAGKSWSEIAKPLTPKQATSQHTQGTRSRLLIEIAKQDMHYAEFAEDESAALLAAIKEYEANKWKTIGAKVGKPAKACEQYAKEHFGGKM